MLSPVQALAARAQSDSAHAMSLETLVSSLAMSLEAGVPAHVVVDPMLGEPIPVESDDVDDAAGVTSVRTQAWGRPVHAIKLSAAIALPPHLHPYLVELHGPADPWLARTAEMAWSELAQSQADGLASSGAAAHRIGGWLQSSLSAPELTQAMAAMFKVNTDAITTARYQRLADRRALAWLRQVAGEARVAGQLGRIQSWCYLDACGELAQLKSPSEVATPLRLSQAEWRSFMQGELLHQTVARWLGERAQSQADHQTSLDARACYARAHVAIERTEAAARRWPQRFTKPADHTAWTALTLLYPGIDTSPDVLAALNVPPQADEPLETLDTLSPALNALRLKATP